jgi:competence protein ComFC
MGEVESGPRRRGRSAGRSPPTIWRGRADAVGQILLEVLFPGRCLLCGQWLLFNHEYNSRARKANTRRQERPRERPDECPKDRLSHLSVPLCGPCYQSLEPIGEARCAKCGTRLISESNTCMRCREAAYAFESNIALFPYAGAAKELIRTYKFGGRSRLAGFFADFVAAALGPSRERFPVVPVPSRPGRRTPDPVERVAACLERRHGIAVKRLLMRTGGSQQKSLDLPRRRENLRGRIRLAPVKGSVNLPTHVILLDDIFTTGATIDACAQVLLDAGCAGVYAITLAIEE